MAGMEEAGGAPRGGHRGGRCPGPAPSGSKQGGEPERLDDMARVRVHTRSGERPPVAMLGLLPRKLLEEIRARLREAIRGGMEDCRIEARLKKIQAVSVRREGREEVVPGRRLVLGIRVRGGPRPPKEAGPGAGVIDIVLEAERIAGMAAAARAASVLSRPQSPDREKKLEEEIQGA